MKKFVFTLALLCAFAVSSFAAVTIHYYNKDSKSYTFKVKVDGVTKSVTFDPSKTSDVTIQCGASEVIIISACGETRVKSGANIEIKDGCITVK